MELTDRQRNLTTIGILFGIFLAAVEGTVVATAMPTAVGAMGSVALIHYVFASYQLATTGTIVIWGKLADVWGLRRSFMLGCFLFLLGSALCGIAQDIYQLIIFRFIQGIGAGALYPVAQTTLALIYSEIKRAKIQVYLSLVWAIASTLGPPIGAFLTENLSWRSVFYLNLPAGLISLILVQTGLRHLKEAGPSGSQLKRPFDWSGSMLVSAGVICAIAAISVNQEGRFLWSLPVITAFAGMSVAFFMTFAFHVNHTPHPFISPAVITNPVLRRAGLGSFFMCMATFGSVAFIPLYCQKGLGQSVAQAGSTLAFFLFGWIVVSGLAARLYLHFSLRTLARVGTLIMAASYWYLGLFLESSPLWVFRISLFTIGGGMGLVFAPTLLGVQSALPRSEMGSGTASLQLLRNLGGLFGVTLLGTLLALDLNSLIPGMGGGLHEHPQMAMTRVFMADGLLMLAALAVFWNLPALMPRQEKTLEIPVPANG